MDNVSSWIGGHKQVNVGNVGYTLEVFVANTQRPILSTFMDNVAPHVGAYGEYNRMYGEYGHGLSGTAQLYVDDDGGIDYIIQPYLQLRRGGTWRFCAAGQQLWRWPNLLGTKRDVKAGSGVSGRGVYRLWPLRCP